MHPLWFLGDAIPITRFVPGIASAGDFLLAAGMFWLIQSLVTAFFKGSRGSDPG